MSITLTVNGEDFEYPETGDEDWGSNATLWASAVTSGMLQKAGGLFSLYVDADFGEDYGLVSKYYKSRGILSGGEIASSGVLRMSRGETIGWRNANDDGNILLAKDGSDNLTINGDSIPTSPLDNSDFDDGTISLLKLEPLPTGARVLISQNGSGVITESSATEQEAAYLVGVTSEIQTQLNSKLALSGGTLTGNLILNAIPTLSLQAATKSYVDSLATGLNAKTAVRIATTANGTLASAFENGDTVDGVVLSTGDRILLKNQSAPAENGIYTVAASGAPVRGTDADTWAELVGAYVFVSAGTANTATSWVCNVAAGGTLGVTAVTFVQFSAAQSYTASGTGITLTGSEFALQLDGTTLSQSGSGVKVNAIANAQIGAAAAIAFNKIAALTASRAVASDGSGFLVSATTTAVELGYVNGLTSSAQTQIDTKIANTLLSSTNDMIYASSANTPARLAAGTTGYILQSASGAPTWTDPKISTTYFTSDAATYDIQTTFTALTLVAVTASLGTPCVRSSNTITFAFTGQHEITLFLGGVETVGGGRILEARLRNTTDSTTLDVSTTSDLATASGTVVLFLRGNVTNIAKVYEIQLACSGTGATLSPNTVNSVSSHLYQLKIDRPRQ